MERNEMESVDFDPFAEGELLLTVPATEPQREVWVAAQMGDEASCAYNESVTLVIKGLVQLDLIKQAIQSLMARHESLSATFSVDGATFCVGQPEELDLPIFDLSTAANSEVESSLKKRVIEEVTQPFNLEHGPLFRAQIIKVSDNESRIIFCAHHIICDGLSWGVLIPDFFALYHAFEQGQVATLPVADRFSDFVHYHNEPEQKKVAAEAENYWLSQFSDQVPQLDFPTDRARPAKKTYRCDRIDYVVNPQHVAGLKKVGAGAGATFVVTLLAAFNTFLSRISEQQDLVVGLMAASQSVSGFQNLVGHCVNLLPVRSQIEDEQSFVDYVKSLRSVMFDALDHQQVSFGSLLKKLALPRDPGRIPLCPITFNIDRAFTDVGAQNLDVEVISNKRSFENFEIFLNAVESPDNGLVLECSYNLDLFDASTIQRRLEEFEQLIASIVQEPQRPLSLLFLLPATEIKQLDDWNQTDHVLPDALLIHQLIEQQAKVTPENIAVVFGEQQLSYVELDARANQLANYLHNKGVTKGQIIGLAIERSEQLLVGILGILKAGGIYLPLDPEYPTARLQYMLDDAKVSLLVTQQALGQRFSDNLEKIFLDSDAEEIAQYSNSLEDISVSEDASAYIIYTSGSTGKPKGVEVPHRCVVNFLKSMAKRPGLNSTDHLLAVTTLSFDIAVLELFLPLSVGARTVIASRETAGDGDLLLKALQQHSISVMQATPATWRILLDTGCGNSSLKVLCGGEPLPLELAKRLCQFSDSVWNMYGPTEATVWSSCSQISALDDLITIGKPIDNTTFHIVDEAMQRMPIGIPGELCIGGEGVVKGYVGRSDLTLDRFVIHQGERLYRTGDLAKFLNNGDVEHLGRLDNQVKVRGFRIELGEIENNLMEHPAIQTGAVIVREDSPGDVRLVGYVVTHAEQEVTEGELRTHLRDSLPEYMIPQHVLELDSLPMTANGKIDRNALPAPFEVSGQSTEDYTVPSNETEQILAKIWQDVLHVNQISVHDNFFDLGGHSLLGTWVMAKVKKELDRDVSLSFLFEAPTIAQLALLLDSENQVAENLLQIKPRLTDEKAVISLTQQRLWYLDQLDLDSLVYNLPAAFRIKGDLDLPALQRSFVALVKRHESLKTIFEWQGDTPIPVINSSFELDIPMVDVQGLANENEFQKLLQQEANKSFSLNEGPLWNIKLYQLGEQEHVLFFMPHHIIFDGWSFDVFIDELSQLYSAYSSGEESPLLDLPFQYADYASWHRQWMQGDELKRQLQYWKNQLAGQLPVLDMPTDFPRPAVQTYHGTGEVIALSSKEVAILSNLARENGVTLYMLILTVYTVLLNKYTGQEDIIIGSPISGRDRPGVDKLIGYFVNTLVLRIKLDETQNFETLLKKVREICLGAFSHQDTPFEQLVEELDIDRDLSRNPVYQTLFMFQDVRNRSMKLGELDLEQVNVNRPGVATDLDMWVKQTQDELLLGMEYNTDLFSAESIQALLKHLQKLLKNISENPKTAINLLSILGEDDKKQQLQDWNDTHVEYPKEKCVHQLFEAQVKRSPDAIAVNYAIHSLSYQQLNERANQLAHHLQDLGIGPDKLVGVLLERSEQMLVALLAVLKAGGAYVPMDPGYPKERIAYMLDHSGINVLLSQSSLKSQAPENSAQTVYLDSEWDRISLHSTDTPESNVQAMHLAYVIYTSGSTGKPKGVQVPHGAVVNFLTSMALKPGLSARDKLLAVTTLSFDIAVLELYLPLIVGAKVEIASSEEALDGESLLAKIRQQSITVMQATPITWRMLLAAGWEGTEGFKILVGGEALPRDLANELIDKVGGLWNMYGPTETTVWSTCEHITDKTDAILIGRPIANTQLYVLDEQLQILPVGVSGELYIGGDSVTRGYLHTEELTAERYIENPYNDDSQSRLYRTGDLVKYHHDGRLEYLSRLDNQVKVRGFRIELGEIETSLIALSAVHDSVVIVREDRPGDKRLVAYVVPESGKDITENEVRSTLGNSLPKYMIPQHVVMLGELPLTANGKIDRKALSMPNSEEDLVAENFVPPRREMEQTLALIWQEVLEIKQIGIYDNFFDLGGHSLLSMQVIVQIRDKLGVKLTPRAMLLNNLMQIAQLVTELVNTNENDGYTLTIPKCDSDTALTLSVTQQRLWYLNQLDKETLAYNLPASFRIKGALDVDALKRSFTELVQRHEVLRTTFQWENEVLVQVIASDFEIEFPVIELPASTDEERLQEILKQQTTQLFNLAEGLLWCVKLFRLSDKEHVLFFMPHHIVFDGGSFDLVISELSQLYSSYLTGEESSLATLPIQYADYAVWHRQWIKGDELKQQLNYWLEQLSGELPVLDMPTDFPRPEVQSYLGNGEVLSITEEQTAKLTNLARDNDATLYMVLLAAYVVVLNKYSGQKEVIIGSPISGRDRPSLDKMIGYFVNTLLLRINLEPDQSFDDLLKHVRDLCLDAFSHQDTPFEKLVDELVVDRDLSRNPLYQTLFMFRDSSEREMKLGDLDLEDVLVNRGGVSTDLDLWANKTGDGLLVGLDYNIDLFKAETVSQFLHHFNVLIINILNDSSIPVDQLTIFDDAAIKQFQQWNATELSYDRSACIHDLISYQAQQNPDSIAVVYEDISLSYAELNNSANQLAHHLQGLGIGPNIPVGVSLERNEQMLIAVLGVLKAGGAYVPMDPDYPSERLSYMLEHSGVTVLLSQSSLQKQLPEHSVHTVFLDSDREIISQNSIERPETGVLPTHVAYVIYTSGSTGKPKGVQVPHGAVVNFLTSMSERPGLSQDDKLLAVTTLSFDIAVLELYLPLAVGATVEIANSEEVFDGERLSNKIDQQGITIMQATPATWRLLLAAGWQGREGFKVLVGGEALPRDLATELIDRTGGVWNMYGPTETTVWSSCEYITEKEGPILIGRPIGNTQLYVLDEQLRIVPVGVPGELYIGGDGVSYGYLNAADLTAERFIENPLTDDLHNRLYKTGDQVKIHHDGRLEYLDRLDSQVKIRGFRIELGEIENSLIAHSAIQEGAVIVREDRPGDMRLVAYIVTHTGTDVTEAEIRQYLGISLPKYMIPQHIVVLEELPTTPNGKIDRKALLDIDPGFGSIKGDSSSNNHQHLETEMQKLIASIWQEVLEIDHIDLYDNFFEIGGYSLLSMQVLEKIRIETGIHVPARAILMDSLAQIASYCEKGENVDEESSAASTSKKIMAGLRKSFSFKK